eukprot:g17912.t1
MIEDGKAKRQSQPGRFSSPSFIVEQPQASGDKLLFGRFIFNHVGVNKIAVPYRFPQPTIADLLHYARPNRLHFLADLAQGYNQIDLTELGQEVYAFTFDKKCYTPLSMGFGGDDFPSFFQATLLHDFQANFTESKQDDCRRLLSAFREKFGRDPEDVSEFVRHFIDDIYAGTPAGPHDAPGEITEATLLSHLAKVGRIFASLSFRGWLVDLNKTQFVAREATLLGHTVADGISLSAGQRHKLQMQGLQEPKSVDDVVSYRCMAVWLRQFCPFFGELVLPLNGFGKKGRSFADYQKDPDAQLSMRYLREAISNLELHAPRAGWTFHLLCDASDVCGAFWLIQTDPTGAAPPIVIFLDYLTFKAYELFWTTTEKEFRTVELALCSCKPTTGGEHVFVHHDHKDSDSIKERAERDLASRRILKKGHRMAKERVERDLASRRILKKGHRMALNIYQTFGRNFTMTWRPGHELIAPDFLSRQFPGAHDAKCAFERQLLSASPIRELVLQLYKVELPKQFLVDLESFGTAHKQRIAAARRGGAPARDLKPKTKPDVVARNETAAAIQPRPQQGSTASRDTSVAVLASLSFSAASSVLPDFPTEFPTLVFEDPDDTVVVPIAVTIAKRAAAQGRLPKQVIPGKVKVRAWSDNRGEGYALSSDKEFESRDGSARRELWLSSRVLGAQRAIECVRFAAKGSIAEQDAFAFTTIKKDESVYPDDAPFFFTKPTAAPVVQPKSKAKGKVSAKKKGKQPKVAEAAAAEAAASSSSDDEVPDVRKAPPPAQSPAPASKAAAGKAVSKKAVSKRATPKKATPAKAVSFQLPSSPAPEPPEDPEPAVPDLICDEVPQAPDELPLDLSPYGFSLDDLTKAQDQWVSNQRRKSLPNDFRWIPVIDAAADAAQQLPPTKKVLAKEVFDEFQSSWKVFVPAKPSNFTTEVIRYHHEDIHAGGHSGREATTAKVRSVFTWVGLSGQVRAYVRACEVCAAAKARPGIRSYPQSSVLINPFHSYEIDFVGPLHKDKGFSYILTCICRLSGFVRLWLAENADADTVASFLCDKLICEYGFFEEVKSDRGSHFTAEVIYALARVYGIKHIKGSAYNPKSQSLIERSHRVLSEFLRAYVKRLAEKPAWTHLVKPAQLATRTHPRCGRWGLSPFQIIHGFSAKTAVSEIARATAESYFEKFWVQRLETLDEVQQQLREQSQELQQQRAAYFRDLNIKKGDRVYVSRSKIVTADGSARRLAPLAGGPFIVEENYGSACLVSGGEPKRSLKVNSSRIIPLTDYKTFYPTSLQPAIQA